MLVKDLIKRRNRILKSAWITLIEKSNIEGAAAIHACSTLEAEELQRFGWRLPRIATIPNGVDEIQGYEEHEVPTDVRKISVERPLVLFLGRISWKKGLDLLLHAFALTHRGKLAIVGPDDEKLVPRLAQLARDLQIGHRVCFLPRTVLGPAKEYLYRSANVFVLPSYSENFGITVLEAMQHGLPVVVTPEVGAAEIVHKCGSGLVVTREPEAIAQAICRLTQDFALARTMGEAGQRHANMHYSWGAIAEQMERLYETLT
jgi:glycosyltransferase involved in cell wall biosynthesis